MIGSMNGFVTDFKTNDMYQRLGIHGWKLYLTKLYVAAPEIEPSCGLESDELQDSCFGGWTGRRPGPL